VSALAWTPGPWKAARISKSEIEIAAKTPRGHLSVAWVHLGDKPTSEEADDGIADAALIASAPGLYAALEGFLSVFWPTAEEGHTGFVDRLGMEFYRETGVWPHFKSEPMEIARDVNREEAQRQWSAWLEAKRNAAAVALAALARARGEEPSP
jgi:hypothetical protein